MEKKDKFVQYFRKDMNREFRTKITEMPMISHVLWMILLGGLITCAVSVGLWRIADTPSIRSLARDMSLLDLIRVALLVTGGIGGIVALVVAYRKQRLSERSEIRDIEASIRDDKAAERAQRAEAREDTKLLNDRFANASGQLGSDKLMSRLAGVYAMATLADDWTHGRQMCIDVLCAYMRQPYFPPQEVDARSQPIHQLDELEQRRTEEQQVRHTIMRVIGQRLRANPTKGLTWHGHNFDFTGAVIDGADLQDAKFTGGLVNFSNTRFPAGSVYFHRSQFLGGRVSFSGAVFSGGSVSFFAARFGKCEVWLNSTFNGADISFEKAIFEEDGRVDFAFSTFSAGSISFQRAEYLQTQKPYLGVDAGAGSLRFYETKLKGGEFDLHISPDFQGQINIENIEYSGGMLDISNLRPHQTGLIVGLPSPNSIPDGLVLPSFLNGNELPYIDHVEEEGSHADLWDEEPPF